MRNSILRLALLFAAFWIPPLALPQTPAPASSPAPAPATPPAKAAPKPAVPNPTLTSLSESVLPLAADQKLLLNGADFQDDASVTLTDPSGKQTPLAAAAVHRLSATQLEITATFDVQGAWKLTVQNPGAAVPSVLSFTVAPPSSADRAQAIGAYQGASLVVTGLLIFIAAVVVLSLFVASLKGWSLGDALSEESSMQPATITSKKDVIMVASSSRIIAFLGLLGILTIVLGVGYAVIWRLFVYGDTPDLSQVRNYLFGSACLFAPYLANQLREVFDRSGTPQPDTTSTETAAATSVTGIAPAPPGANANPQAISLTGSGFQSGLSVTLTGPTGNQLTLTGAAVTVSSPTLAATTATLDQPGDWKASVTNPGASPSSAFRFTVVGPPTVAGVIPQNPAQGPAPVHNNNPQTLTITGDGFMSGLTVQLTDPGQHVVHLTAPPDIVSISPTRLVVKPTLAAAGAWRAVVTNPGGRASAPFDFNVT